MNYRVRYHVLSKRLPGQLLRFFMTYGKRSGQFNLCAVQLAVETVSFEMTI